VEELDAGRISTDWEPDSRYCEGTFLQYLASRTWKLEKLQLLLNHGVDPRAATEEVAGTPLEIAAMNENTEAFDLLAPHYEDDTKKKIAQLLIWGLTDWVPSAAFKLMFESVPVAEVNSYTILAYNLLQIFAYKGRRAHVAFLLEQGVDPETKAAPERPCPLDLAWSRKHAGTIAELVKYTEADWRKRSSSFWPDVEKEQERSWRQEVDGLLRKQQTEVLSLKKQNEDQQKQIEDQQKQIENQSRLIKLIAKASGIEVEE